VVTQVLYVLEAVQNQLCIAGLVLQAMAVYVHRVVEAEQLFVQQHHQDIAVIEQMDFVQQTEVQTVD
jgi:hypothetical protein